MIDSDTTNELIRKVKNDRLGGPKFYPTAWRIDKLRYYSIYLQAHLVFLKVRKQQHGLSPEEEDQINTLSFNLLMTNIQRIRFIVDEFPQDFTQTIKSFIVKPFSGGGGFFLQQLRDALEKILNLADDDENSTLSLVSVNSLEFSKAIDLLRRHAMNKEADIYEDLLKRAQANRHKE